MCFLVCEGGFTRDDRFRKSHVHYICFWCHFLSNVIDVSVNTQRTGCSRTQNAENARRSTNGRSEHKLVPRRAGNISIRLSTRYTVVPREAASLSIGVSAWTKCDTSAMSFGETYKKTEEYSKLEDVRTPASMFPLGSCLACKASSIS